MASLSEARVGRRVLVTGASGFTGRYVVPALCERGMLVSTLGQEGHGPDLLDPDGLGRELALVQPEVVVHLAAISFVAHSDVEEMYRVNIVGTRNLLEALVQLDVPPRQVILASSANVYGSRPGVLDENVQPAPVNDYAISKLAMELMSQQYVDRLPITVLRPFNYTGVGQSERFLIPKIVGSFAAELPRIELGNLSVSRDFNDVRNVAEAYAQFATIDGEGETYNVCSGAASSLLDILDMMREISGRSLEVVVNPAFVRANEIERLVGSRAKLDNALGRTQDFDLAATLRWMYESLCVKSGAASIQL